jgi:hypothetical protein
LRAEFAMNQHFETARVSPSPYAGWTPALAPSGRTAPRRGELPLQELEFRRLRTPGEIAEIQHLRSEIHLPVATLRSAEFGTLEKKETRKASWEPSSGMTP